MRGKFKSGIIVVTSKGKPTVKHTTMKTILAAFCASTFAALAADTASTPSPKKGEAINAEVVFVLDTTGSMTGLIEGAKQKIWSIAGGIIQKTGGEVRIGLIPYRDKGDEYVTKIFPLTNNLDQVYSYLQGFKAAGGGDMPESVNQALYEAVSKIQWSDSKQVMRTIFLVGDCPPHMDYKDDVRYPESCAVATVKHIVVNTVQCGSQADTERVWRDIAEWTNGGYSQIGQSGNMRMVKTPFDDEIQKVNIEVSKTVLPYGSMAAQASFKRLVTDNIGASAYVAASRNAVKASAMKGYKLAAPVAGQDLTAEPGLLDKLSVDDLPEVMQKLSPEERQAKLDEAVSRRKELNAKLLELNGKRAEWLRKYAETAKQEIFSSFDAEVLKSIENQLKAIRNPSK